jgi:hypothetical protein
MKKKHKKRQRKPWHGVWGREPERGPKADQETWEEIETRFRYNDSPEWLMIDLRHLLRQGVKDLRHLIGDGSQFRGNYLSEPIGERDWRIDRAWTKLCWQFERAVLNGDAKWFTRQANAIKNGGETPRGRFNAKVVRLLYLAVQEHLLEVAMRGTRTERRKLQAALGVLGSPFPAGKFTDAMARHIFDALDKHEKDGKLYVEGCIFGSEKLVMEAIQDIAKRLQVELPKQG